MDACEADNHSALTCCSVGSGLLAWSTLVRARPVVSDPIVTQLVTHAPQHGFRLAHHVLFKLGALSRVVLPQVGQEGERGKGLREP